VRAADRAAGAGAVSEEIEHLAEASSHWRGTALAGFDGQYFSNVRARLDEERLVVAERLLMLRVRAGEAGAVVSELIDLVQQHPLRQSLRVTLMTALHETGRQAEALEMFEELRRLLADEFGLDPSEDLRALQADILKGLPLSAHGAEAAAAGRPTPTTPHSVPKSATVVADSAARRFLPHLPRDFSGRSRELEQLAAESRRDPGTPVVISAINGMGGVGKTTLALRLAGDVADDYPDGQFFVDLQGFTANADPLTASTALGSLLRQLGLPVELIPPDFEDRTVLWRSRMAGQRAIVMLDNVLDEEQIRPLIPGTDETLVLVTSRRKLASLEGAASFFVDVMAEDEAVALFTAIVGESRLAASRIGVAEVVRLCGLLPLAVRIAAARFRDRTSWTIPYLVSQLSDRELRSELLDVGNRSVSQVLDMSYKHLPPDTRRFFRTLSLSPGPHFTAATASALTGLSLRNTRTMLGTLFDDNLIMEDRPGTYRFHDLVRDHALSLAMMEESAADRALALNRLIDHYLQCLHTWSKGLARGAFRIEFGVEYPSASVVEPTSAEHALALLATEHANIMSVARTALMTSGGPRGWQLMCALQPYLRQVNYAGESLELFEKAIGRAQADGSVTGQALCHYGAGLIHRERLAHSAAKAHLEKAIALSMSHADETVALYPLVDLGVVLINEGNFGDAYTAYQSAMDRTAGLDPTDAADLRAGIENNFAIVCMMLGRFTEARAKLMNVLHASREAADPTSEINALTNLGYLAIDEGAGEEAISFFEEALRIGANEQLAAYGETIIRAGLSEACCATGKLRRAFDEGRRALLVAQDYSLLESECAAFNALGEAYLSAGEPDSAESVFHSALKIARQRRLSTHEARAHEGLGHVALSRKQWDDALTSFSQAADCHPPAAAGAENPRQHIASLPDDPGSCRRCRAA